MAFLRWWAQVVQTESIFDLSRGYFADQSWFQHAPSFVSGFAELRHPGYNLAAWNIDQHRLAQLHG